MSQNSEVSFEVVGEMTPADIQTYLHLEKQMRAWLDDGLLEVPPMPQAIAEAIQLSSDPQVSVSQLEELIKKDQAISGRLIKLVNSPLFRGFKDITTISQAITRLGRDELRMVLFGMFVESRMFRSEHYNSFIQRLWTHSLATGTLARMIASIVGLEPEVAYLAGFLHDVGMCALLGTLITKSEVNGDIPDAVLEAAMMDIHEEAGEILANKWNMPAEIREAIMAHHRFLKADRHLDLAALVQLSNVLTYRYHLGFSEEEVALYENAGEGYLPLKISYQNAKLLNLDNYPPFEYFSLDVPQLFEKIEENIELLREQLKTPFVSEKKIGLVKDEKSESKKAEKTPENAQKMKEKTAKRDIDNKQSAGQIGWMPIAIVMAILAGAGLFLILNPYILAGLFR